MVEVGPTLAGNLRPDDELCLLGGDPSLRCFSFPWQLKHHNPLTLEPQLTLLERMMGGLRSRMGLPHASRPGQRVSLRRPLRWSGCDPAAPRRLCPGRAVAGDAELVTLEAGLATNDRQSAEELESEAAA